MSASGNCPYRQQELLEQALAQGKFRRNDHHLPGLYRIGPGWGMMNAGHLFATDALDKASLSAAYTEGRRLVQEYLEFYREYFEGCRDIELVATAPLLGVRESGRVLGEYEIAYRDFSCRRNFADGMGRCAGSVDIHVCDATDEEYRRYRR